MSNRKHSPVQDMPCDADLFTSSEEAWMWYCQCQIARDEGVRFLAGRGQYFRPCDPDDIVIAVESLYRKRHIDRRHMVVLNSYGMRLSPPNGSLPEEREAAALWDQALDYLGDILKAKGIIY
jgi:hypothetical protein